MQISFYLMNVNKKHGKDFIYIEPPITVRSDVKEFLW